MMKVLKSKQREKPRYAHAVNVVTQMDKKEVLVDKVKNSQAPVSHEHPDHSRDMPPSTALCKL